MLGFRPAGLWALLAGLTEFGGGLLVALGLLTPLGALGIVGAMLVASATHWPKVWAMERGFEYPLVLLTVAAAVGLLGPGALSLDAALALALPSQTLFLLGLVPTLVGVAVALATRAPSQAPAAQAAPTGS
jgi:putative oxidoreductase